MAASRDPCTGEAPPGQNGGAGGGAQETQPLKPVFCPLAHPQLWLRAAHIAGLRRVPRWFPSAAVPTGHWHGRLPAAPSHRRPGGKLPHLTPQPLACLPAQARPHTLAGPSGPSRVPPCSTHCCISGLRAPSRWTYVEPGTSPPRWGPLLPCLQALEGMKWGPLGSPAPAPSFLFLGNPHSDLLFVIKVHILNALLGPMCGQGR